MEVLLERNGFSAIFGQFFVFQESALGTEFMRGDLIMSRQRARKLVERLTTISEEGRFNLTMLAVKLIELGPLDKDEEAEEQTGYGFYP